MARRDYVPSRSRMLWTVFCLMLCSLGFLGNAWGATIPVTNTTDSGPGSLRQAIITANADNAGDIINITATGTITLLSTLPAITANITITGPGANLLTVSGGNSTTVGTIFTITTGVTASISGLTISNGNSSSSDQGGGILNDGTLTVSNCTILGNSGTSSVNNEGGGITNFGTLTVSSTSLSGNSAANGGGIFNGDGNTLTVTNSTFSGNSVTAKGGGIYNLVGGTLTVSNSTISGNSGGEGGGIETGSTTTTITNSIVAGNTATTNDDIDGTFTDGGGNVITPASPIALAPLANYGGPTQTMLPAPNSPAICAGTADSLTTDQRGFTIGSGYCASGKFDSGAVQTKYTAIQFTNPNTGIGGYAAAVSSAVAFPANPIVSVRENGLNQGGVPVTLTSDATGATGLGPVTTVAGAGATFDSIKVPEAGSFTLSATLTPGSATLNTSANLKIVSITVSPSSLAGATVNRPYTVTFSASGGSTSTFTFSLTGTPPPGITFNAGTATLAGTPTATGSASLTVTATDSNGFTGTQSYTLTVNAAVTATQTVASKTLTANHATTSFTPVTGSGGTTPLTYSISPALPAGLSISSSTGAITGTPTAASAPISYAVTVTDVNGSTATANFALTVNSAVTATLAVATKTLTANQLASFTPVTGSGGTTPLTYSISPVLPAGLALNSSTGAITGTPTAASPQTMYTVTVTDNNQATATGSFSLTVNAAVVATLVIPTKTLTANQSVSFTPVTGSGGTTPLIFSIAPSLPAGLNISSSTGVISGAPTATSAATTYTVTVTDSNNATATASFSLAVNTAVTATQAVSTKILTANHATTSFTPVTGSGGTTPLSYSVAPALPAGLTLNTSIGAITGTPTVASAAISYTVTVTDGNHATAIASFSLTVNSAVTAAQSIAATTLTVSQSPASFTPVTGSGGTMPLTYAISPLLPAGLSLSATTGLITGTPTAPSAQTVYTVTVTDGNQATAAASFSLTVNSAVTATSVNTETLTVNQLASFTPVTGSGGTAPLRYSISPSLSAGLTLNTSTGAVTGTQTVISAATTYTVTVTDVNQVTAQANFTLTVTAATTSVSVTSSSTGNASTVNDSVTFTAKVTPFSGTTAIPPPYPGTAATVTGSVSFTDNGNSICTSPVSLVSGTYVATCTTSSLLAASSPHTIVATYLGNSNYNSSNNSVTQTVTPAKSNTALVSSPTTSIVLNPKNYNDNVTFTATVTPFSASVPLTGSVTFSDSGAPILGCPTAVPVNPAAGVAICTTAFTIGGTHLITATYGSDLNYSGSNSPMPVTQSVQDFSLALPATGQVAITHGFTNNTDPVSPQPFAVTVSSIQGFATASGMQGALICTFTPLGAPSDAVMPSCPTAPLTIPPPNNAQTLPITIDATSATPGSYSLVVTGVDPTTGLSRSTPMKFTVNVAFITSTPITLASGSTTDTTFNFTLPAGVSVPINCNFATISPSVTPVPTSTIPIGCTLSVSSVGSTTSTSFQSVPVTVTINTGGAVTQLMTQTNTFLAGLLGIPAFALIGYLTRGKHSRKSFFKFLGVAFIVAAVLQNIGCGGSFNRTTTATNTTPAGVYYLIVQGPGTGANKQPYQAIIQVNVIR